MLRFLLLLIVVAGAFVVAERTPAVRARLPWLPTVPGLSAPAAQTANTAEGGGEARERGGRGGGRRGGAEGPIPVLTAAAKTADVPVTADVLGTVEATNTVLVRPQVDGKLLELDFKEGQDVRRGDVLARIDPATYQASYDQAVAKKAQDEATLANAQVDLARYQKLAETQYGSHQQADTQRALVAQTQAQVEQDQAAVNNTKAVLDYATIRSPLDGRTGIRQIDAGNIVHATDATGIVMVAAIKPIAATFNLPQQWLRRVNAAMARGRPKLEARDGDTGAVLDTGTLDVVDNTVDQTTGTVKMKGSFPNAEGPLWPGQFVNLRLFVDTERNDVVVPTSAVQRGPEGAFVYVVKDGHTALTKVTAGLQTETDTVIASGLVPPADVVTTGFTRLTDGAAVAVGGAAPEKGPGPVAAETETNGPAARAPDAGEAAPPTGEGRRHRRDRAGASGETGAGTARPATP